MATFATAPSTCTIQLNLFTGARAPLPAGTEVLVTVRDGNQNIVNLPGNGFFKASTINITGIPFTNGLADSYTVVASSKGLAQAGFTPVPVNPQRTAIVDLMLIPKDAGFNFHDARWDVLQLNHSDYADLLRAGAADNASAADRYTQLLENQPSVLACYFNLVTAMSQIHLRDGTPLDYIQELIWDGDLAMKQDRFFAWAHRELVDEVNNAAQQGLFAPEVGTALFHEGATRSWKEVRFGEANVQLTFHENQTKTIDGKECVIVEPDIDYFRDPLAHALLEVVPNQVSHSLTDPREVYMLRWIAGRRAGVPNFEPPYILV